MERLILASKGNSLTIKEGDKVELIDGRILTVQNVTTPNGKVSLIDSDGRIVFSNPRDILRIVEEVLEGIERAKGFWAWLKETIIVRFIIGLFTRKK